MLILSFNFSFLLTGEIVVERNLSLAQIFKRHPRQKYGGAQKIFLIFFSDEMMNYKGISRLVLYFSGKERYLSSKLSNIWMNRKV